MGSVFGPFIEPEPVTSGDLASFGTPTAWWKATTTVLRGQSDPEIVYLVEPGSAAPLDRVDRRGRKVIEAFTALPLGRISEALTTYWAQRRRRPSLQRAQGPLSRAARPLIDFVETFGPVGVAWGAELAVRNPAAPRLQGEGSTAGWVADMRGLGPGRFGRGLVTPTRWMPSESDIWTRLEHDSSLRSDRLADLLLEQEDLIAALRLAELLRTRGSERQVRDAVRAAVRGNRDQVQRLNLNRSSPWPRALRDPLRGRAELQPFGRDAAWINWPEYGRIALAELITRQLNWLQVRAEATSTGRWARTVRPTSLMELIYLQLLEQLERRARFGFAWCPTCGGALLRTRERDVTRNRRHRGCGTVARVARHRAQRVE